MECDNAEYTEEGNARLEKDNKIIIYNEKRELIKMNSY